MGSEAVEALLPHREPFLFVDRIVDRTSGGIVTEWSVPPDAFWVRGHYPGNPILPGVIALEFALQSAALLLGAEPQAATRTLPILTRIEDARFRRIVRPGELLRAELALEESLGPARWVAAHVRNAQDELVLRARFVVAAHREPG